MIQDPDKGRAKVNFDGINFSIRIPSRKKWFIILFLLAWMAGWYIGEISALQVLASGDRSGPDAFMIFWLIGWSLGGIFAIGVLLWNLFGYELIVTGQGIITVSKCVLEIPLVKKSYNLNSVKNLELNPVPVTNDFLGSRKKTGEFWGFTGGTIRFTYGMRTVKFGIGIDEAEAYYLIEQLKKNGF